MRATRALLVTAVLLVGPLGRCGEEPAAPRVVVLAGAEAAFNYSRSCLAWGTSSREDHPPAVLAADGDLLLVGEGGPLPYRAADGVSLAVKAEGATVVLGGHRVAMELSTEPQGWDWLAGAEPQALRRLRMVALDDPPTPRQAVLLVKLTDANPRVGLLVENDVPPRHWASLFRPRWLVCSAGALSDENEQVAELLRDVEFLALAEVRKHEALAAPSLGFLARTPRLRTLVLTDWHPEATGPLPEGCEALRSLGLVGGTARDLAPVAHATGLRSLWLVGCGSLEDIGWLAALPGLEALSLTGCRKLSGLEVLGALPDLRWLGFPPGTTQEQFAAAVRGHPRLEVVELVGCEKVRDLRPLGELEALRAVVVVKSKADVAPLGAIKTLRLLALDEAYFEESPQAVERLEAALPDCRVAQGGTLCLGSGWLLVLVPAAGLSWALARRRRRARHG
ncbi:MAG: hypothetical protein ACLF0G_00465 [Candidatus Brocadiia bacterium]